MDRLHSAGQTTKNPTSVPTIAKTYDEILHALGCLRFNTPMLSHNTCCISWFELIKPHKSWINFSNFFGSDVHWWWYYAHAQCLLKWPATLGEAEQLFFTCFQQILAKSSSTENVVYVSSNLVAHTLYQTAFKVWMIYGAHVGFVSSQMKTPKCCY